MEAQPDVATEPKLRLTPGSIVSIQGRMHEVQQRAADRWKLQSIEDNETRFFTDRELFRSAQEGELVLLSPDGSRIAAHYPLSPLAIDEPTKAANARKAEFVAACRSADGCFVARSRRVMQPLIAACAERMGEKPPSFTAVIGWIGEHVSFSQQLGSAAHTDRHDLKGGRGSKLPDFQERALAAGIEAYLALGSVSMAYAVVFTSIRNYEDNGGAWVDKVALGPRFVDSEGHLRLPSLRTFQRRCAGLTRPERDFNRYGRAQTKQRNTTFRTRELPTAPYEEVEVDHCTLDIQIVDRSGTILGRPDLVILRDRATGCILGKSVGFDQPSYASFVEALRHATYPKDLDAFPAVTKPWPCHGRIENLIVDNALHFIGHSIEAAGHELGFNIIRLAPREPWLKGALERFFRTLNTGLLHELPGTTRSNVLERRQYENEAEPTITIDELNALIVYWIVMVYHEQPSKALGLIRGLPSTPIETWARKAADFRTALPPNPDLFMALAGEVTERTIQRNGITEDHLVYESPGLWDLLSHPKHRRRSDGQPASRYKVVRDPQDLSQIAIHNPYDRTIIRIPIVDAHRSYAAGLGLHQHRVIVANVKSQSAEKVDIEGLMAAKAALAELAQQALNHPRRKKVQRMLARFIDGERARRHRSDITSHGAPLSGERFLPIEGPRTGARSYRSLETLVPQQEASGPALGLTEHFEDDDFLRYCEEANWTSYNEYPA